MPRWLYRRNLSQQRSSFRLNLLQFGIDVTQLARRHVTGLPWKLYLRFFDYAVSLSQREK